MKKKSIMLTGFLLLFVVLIFFLATKNNEVKDLTPKQIKVNESLDFDEYAQKISIYKYAVYLSDIKAFDVDTFINEENEKNSNLDGEISYYTVNKNYEIDDKNLLSFVCYAKTLTKDNIKQIIQVDHVMTSYFSEKIYEPEYILDKNARPIEIHDKNFISIDFNASVSPLKQKDGLENKFLYLNYTFNLDDTQN